jgi:DHA2 family multidrug resistance protein-like MFS transporter
MGDQVRKWAALGGLALATLAVGLDGTVLSVALPTLARALHASEADLQWFSSGYLLVLAATMLPVGLLGDRVGRKKVLLASLLLFAVDSAACARAATPDAFIATRAVLGLAGAGVVVMNLSAVTVLFTPEERPQAVGVWSAANFLGLPIGPILGGWLLTHYWWGWVFLMNVPVAVIGLLAALAFLPESRASARPGLDPVGVLASAAGLTCVTYGLIEAGQRGWIDASSLVPIGAGLALLAGFVLWELLLTVRPGGQPLVDLSLFGSSAFSWGVTLAAIGGLALVGALFTLPQYFQGVLGTDAMGSGLRLLPLIAGLLLGVAPADRVAHRLGAKVAVAAGFVVLGAGLLLGSTTAPGAGTGFLVLWLGVAGMGLGLAFATAASTALSELSEERSGMAAAVMQALGKMAGPLGTAIMGSALSTAYLARLPLSSIPSPVASAVRMGLFSGVAAAARLHDRALLHAVRIAFVDGMDFSLLVAAGIAAAGMLLALAFMPARGTSARRAAPGPPADPRQAVREGPLTVFPRAGKDG